MKKNDSSDTIFVLDPPWENVNPKAGMNYGEHKAITASEVYTRTRKLKGAVAVVYRNDRSARRALCKPPFRCSTIKKMMFKTRFTQLLAVKQPSGRPRAPERLNWLPDNIRLVIR